MSTEKRHKPTTYVAIFWDEETETKIIGKEFYPMYLYSLNDVFEKVKGREKSCCIYESRYLKDWEKYVCVKDCYEFVDGFWIRNGCQLLLP